MPNERLKPTGAAILVLREPRGEKGTQLNNTILRPARQPGPNKPLNLTGAAFRFRAVLRFAEAPAS
jgi:hypothetical protein